MFQYRFVKINEFGWWVLDRISADVGTQFNPTEIEDTCQTCGVRLTLAAPEHQEINGLVKVKWRTFHTISHSCMVHARVLESYIHFALMYMTAFILRVLPIKDLRNKDGKPTTTYRLGKVMKP